MPIKQISPEDAKKLLDQPNGYIYLDVRSEFEFGQGHAENAFNIPIKNLNPAVQMLEDNPDFLSVVQANFEKDAKLILGCASGQRSFVAGQMLEQLGYEDLSNLDSGFTGICDPFGNVLKKGWTQLGYPTDQGDGGERGYPSMQAKM